MFSQAIPDCFIIHVGQLGDAELKEKDFYEILADTYRKLKGLVAS